MRLVNNLQNAAEKGLLFICLGTAAVTASGCGGQSLDHGYSRKGNHILFKGKRIDREGAHDFNDFAVAAGHKLNPCRMVDAKSFRVYSEDYTGDNDHVFYKWISGPRFWVVELPGADPETFQVMGLGLAKDKNNVWKNDTIVTEADSKSASAIEAGRVWLDANHVWFHGNIIEGADPKSFEAVGDGYHYRDTTRVYWIFNVVKVVEGVDPKTFKPTS